MRTTIDIDKNLLEEAMKMSTVNTKKALIELSLKLFIKQKRKESLLKKSSASIHIIKI
jgi:Arc/MetJ family transcription regulator